MSAGTCRYCQSTDDQTCPAPCRWRDDTRTVCSACDDGERIARALVLLFPRTGAGRVAPCEWTALPELDRQQLVMRELMAFLDERFWGDMRADESPTSMAIRLLSEGRTSRIVVA